MKIAIVGPPHSGKSCLGVALRAALAVSLPSIRPYCIDTTPDGEGAWFQEAYRRNPSQAAALKARKKRVFDWPWTIQVVDWVRCCSLPLCFIDTGGCIDAKLAVICRWATHAILVSCDPEQSPDWRSFVRCLGIPLVADIVSRKEEIPSSFSSNSGTLSIEIGGLERGRDHSFDPAIKALASHIANLAELDLKR